MADPARKRVRVVAVHARALVACDQQDPASQFRCRAARIGRRRIEKLLGSVAALSIAILRKARGLLRQMPGILTESTNSSRPASIAPLSIRSAALARRAMVAAGSGLGLMVAAMRGYKPESAKPATADLRADTYWAGVSRVLGSFTLTGAVYHFNTLNQPVASKHTAKQR